MKDVVKAIIGTILFILAIAGIFVWFVFHWYQENKFEIAENILESHDFTVIHPLPKLSITDVFLADSSKNVITEDDKRYLTSNSHGFIKVSVKNDGRKTENVTINFRFLDPNDEAAKKYGQPLLDKLIKNQVLKGPEGLEFKDLSQSQNIPPGPKNFYGRIDVKKVGRGYFCVEVELSVKDKESGETLVKDSEHYVLGIHDP